jgi:hypothetical protein
MEVARQRDAARGSDVAEDADRALHFMDECR